MRTAFGRHCGYVNIRPLNREDSVLYFPPEAFGPFRVLHQIGAGTLGPVFRAVEPGRDRLVAIKVFRLDLTPEQSAGLVRALEHLIAKRLQHPSIVGTLAAGLESGAAFLAQEYAVGDSLDVVLRERGRLPHADVVQLAGSIADAIDRAADAGVTHGSLHPRDIILSGDGARITGFGVGEALATVGATLPVRPPYSGFDGATDVHALAAIAFEAISGRRLSEANLDELEHEQGPAFRNVFSAALAHDRRARAGRASDFAAALRHAGEPVDAAPLDRFVDVDPVDNLTINPFVPEPEREPEPLAQLPESWSAQPTSRSPLLPILLLSAITVALIVGYFLMTAKTPARPAEPPAAAVTKPSVAETTVELPEKPPPSPAPPTPAPTPPQSAPIPLGSLLVRSSPANADVTVNGKPSGQTPITMRNLPLGSYTIRVVREGYVPEQQRVQLTAQKATAATSFSLRPVPVRSTSGVGSINVRSRPAGAQVFVNDRLMGSTPLAIPGIPAGSATVRIEMDGYRPWTTTVQVNAGEPTAVNASLDTR